MRTPKLPPRIKAAGVQGTREGGEEVGFAKKEEEEQEGMEVLRWLFLGREDQAATLRFPAEVVYQFVLLEF
jgi:hypothetical protein